MAFDIYEDKASPFGSPISVGVPTIDVDGVPTLAAKPRRSFNDLVGSIGDALLMAGGRQALYAPFKEKKAQQEALAGFMDNPMKAIRRLAAAGYAEEALQLHTKMAEQNTAKAKAAREQSEYEDQTWDRVTALLGSAKSPESYPMLRDQALKYLSARGVKAPFDIPETYDADAIKALRYSGVPTKTQISEENDQAYRDARLEDIDAQREIQEANVASQIAARDAQIAQGDARIGIAERRLAQSGAQVNKPSPTKVLGSIYEKVQRGEKLTPGEVKILRYNKQGRTKAEKGGAPSISPERVGGMKPRKVGDQITNPNTGRTLISRDGKTWTLK